jgi:hypothetical protein
MERMAGHTFRGIRNMFQTDSISISLAPYSLTKPKVESGRPNVPQR